VVRRLIRGYIEQRLGRPWNPAEEGSTTDRGSARGTSRRRAPRS
jgi:hypothetical protein